MKVVYILGAGFSVEACAPAQAGLLSEAVRLYEYNPLSFDTMSFEIFKNFVTTQLGFSSSNLKNVELEDISTPIDRCLSENSQFRGVGFDQLLEVRPSVFYVIGRTIQLLLNETSKPKEYINKFASYLTEQSSIRCDRQYKDHDPVSVISANRDILLDNSIYQSITNKGHDAVVDYCCYISSRDESDESIKPGFEKLGQGGFNVELLKMHGSLNWLQCQRCMRLYACFYQKEIISNSLTNESCRHCDKNFPEEKNNHQLVSNLIMPTYIKDLSNPQYKIVWQNGNCSKTVARSLMSRADFSRTTSGRCGIPSAPEIRSFRYFESILRDAH